MRFEGSLGAPIEFEPGFGDPKAPLEDYRVDDANVAGLRTRFKALVSSQVNRLQKEQVLAAHGDVIEISPVYPPTGVVAKGLLPEWTDDNRVEIAYRPPQFRMDHGVPHVVDGSCAIEASSGYLNYTPYSQVLNDLSAVLFESWCHDHDWQKQRLGASLPKYKKSFATFLSCDRNIKHRSLFGNPSKAFLQRVTLYVDTMNYCRQAEPDLLSADVTCPPHENCLCKRCCNALQIHIGPYEGHFDCFGCTECISRKHLDDNSNIMLFAVFYPEFTEAAYRVAGKRRSYAEEVLKATEKKAEEERSLIAVHPSAVDWIMKPPEGPLAVPADMNLLPQTWDERALTSQLTQLRDRRPALLPHFVQSIMERMIIGQDDRTAQVRLRYLHTQIEQLKLAKEFQQALADLKLQSSETFLRVRKLQLEVQKVDVEFETVDALKHKKTELELKKLDLEIAQIEDQIGRLKRPPRAEPELSPEQKRAQQKKNCEKRIAQLKAEKQEALKIGDEQERLRKVNAIDAALEREYERWATFL